MKDNMPMTRNKGMVFLPGLMGESMKVIGVMASNMAKAFMLIKMEKREKVTGK